MERLVENYKRYCDREAIYKKFGYDIEGERNFIIEKAGPLTGEILEIGTGKGYCTVALAKKGCCFTTVDISGKEQESAKMNLQYLDLEKQVKFLTGNAENLNFADNSFSLAFSINLVHHLEKLFKVVDELIRVVSPGGKIILSDFSREGFELVDKVHISENGHNHPVGHFNLDDVAEYLSKKNVSTEKCQSRFQEVIVIQR